MDPIENLKEFFKKFPGIGPRQAERFVYFLLYSNSEFKKSLAQAIMQIESGTKKCSSCNAYFVSKDATLCPICSDESRDKSVLIFVEKESDISKIEKSGSGYNGSYFVLQGTLSPLNDSSKHKKYMDKIKSKLNTARASELILALSTTFEGEYTLNFIKEELEDDPDFKDLKISMLGRGLSSGLEIEYTDPETLKHALKNRKIL